MSNGSVYLDLQGFATAMTKYNIHFEAPEVAIPLIFDQLVGGHVALTEDAFVGWIMSQVEGLHTADTASKSVAFDRRIDTLFALLTVIQQEQAVEQHSVAQKKRGRKSKVVNPFEVQSLYASSGGAASKSGSGKTHFNVPDATKSFKALTSVLPPRQKQYHQHSALSLRTPSTVRTNVAAQPALSMRSVVSPSKSRRAADSRIIRGYTVHGIASKSGHRAKPYKKRTHQEKSAHFSAY